MLIYNLIEGDNMNLEEVRLFCKAAHESIGQKRKYSCEPYWTHPFAVADMVAAWGMDEITQAAALLHDVAEDVYRGRESEGFAIIEDRFGIDVARVVFYTTEISKKEDGPRRERKRIDHEHYAKGCFRSQAIKIADAIHNLESIRQGDPEFYKVYLVEKEAMVTYFDKAPEAAFDAWKRFLRGARLRKVF